MAASYLKNYVDELRKVGDVVFRHRHRAPVLIVTARAAELVNEPTGRDKTSVSARSAEQAQGLAILHRVFLVTKAPHAPRGPVVLGRSAENDIPIPEYSISKRHCFFEFEPGGVKIADCGSTNGTFLGDDRLDSGQSVLLRGGETIVLGRFAFLFHTAAGFHTYVRELAKT